MSDVINGCLKPDWASSLYKYVADNADEIISNIYSEPETCADEQYMPLPSMSQYHKVTRYRKRKTIDEIFALAINWHLSNFNIPSWRWQRRMRAEHGPK